MNANRPFSQAVWDQTPAAVQDDIDALEVRVAALESTVQRLEATVQHLLEHVQQTSRTSSRPPSSDPPQAAGQPSRRAPSGRRLNIAPVQRLGLLAADVLSAKDLKSLLAPEGQS